MGVARLHWRGDEVRRKVVDATLAGVDQTMARCVARAKADHPPYPPASKPGERFANRDAHLEMSIQIVDAAEEVP